MNIVAIIFGLLLLAFGGGCVLMFVVFSFTDPKGMLADIPVLLTTLVPFGVLPAILGWFLFRWGVKRDRKQQAEAIIHNPSDPGEPS
ncbi:hypothetical protein [Aestuariivirga sp.]|uniref:hypothetical protein n=1 Tax=Aestuariivirga sp. TaxID=2650926 RepID=UPI0035941EE0